MFYEYNVSVTTTGEAGSATGTGQSAAINGSIHAIVVNYHASAPGTTTVDVDEVGGAARKLLDKAASATDVTHYPRVLVQDTTGANLTAVYDTLALAGRAVTVTVALSDALTGAVVVTLIVEEDR